MDALRRTPPHSLDHLEIPLAPSPDATSTGAERSDAVVCPFDLHVDRIARFLNAELADDPVYDGVELQWFDDAEHGTGMLAFLSRRADRLVDYYLEPGLVVDRAAYTLGAGTGVWSETAFAARRLEVHPEGVVADVAFTDRDGRDVAIRIDDRGTRPNRRGALLAPVGSTIDHPTCLLLVHLHGMDLVRRRSRSAPPTIRVAGRSASTGVLPGRRVHRRELIKYAAPLDAITVNRAAPAPIPLPRPDATASPRTAGGGVAALVAGEGPAEARLEFRPSVPDLRTLADGEEVAGAWRVRTPGVPPLTGGRWSLRRHGDTISAAMDVTDGWRPGRLPPLLAVVTRAVPVFRRWPTTYRWRATVRLDDPPHLASRWERVGGGDDAYRRATGTADAPR
jgi:hypothetical protein